MIEPIRVHDITEVAPANAELSRDQALLWRAMTLALESAVRYGVDMPVGAVAAAGNLIVGRHFASDRRFGHEQTHAEFLAISDWMAQERQGAPAPDTLVVSLEPCVPCQDFIATVPSIKRVGFGLSRVDASERGLVRHHDESAAERGARIGLPYEIFQIADPELHEVGGIILDHTLRDINDGMVYVDSDALEQVIAARQGFYS